MPDTIKVVPGCSSALDLKNNYTRYMIGLQGPPHIINLSLLFCVNLSVAVAVSDLVLVMIQIRFTVTLGPLDPVIHGFIMF